MILLWTRNWTDFFLNETWQLSDVLPAYKADTPTTHHYYLVMGPVTGSDSPGGGCGVIISRHIPNIKFLCRKFRTFECIEIQFNCSNDKFVVDLVYRPAGHIRIFFAILRVY